MKQDIFEKLPVLSNQTVHIRPKSRLIEVDDSLSLPRWVGIDALLFVVVVTQFRFDKNGTLNNINNQISDEVFIQNFIG